MCGRQTQILIMELTKKYANFVRNCFNYNYFHKYRFNYGDNEFSQHTILRTPLPAYIQSKFALHAHDWMGFIHVLINKYGDEEWFTVKLNLYGTAYDAYLVMEYNGWCEVLNRKGKKAQTKRVLNTGPNDMPIDVFWLYIIDLAYESRESFDVAELLRIFKHTIWFYLCEKREEAIADMTSVKNNYICKYYSKD